MIKTNELTGTHPSQRDRPFSSKARTRKKHFGFGVALFMMINLLLVPTANAQITSCDPGYYLTGVPAKCVICSAGKCRYYYNNFRFLLRWWHRRLGDLCNANLVHPRLQRVLNFASRSYKHCCYCVSESVRARQVLDSGVWHLHCRLRHKYSMHRSGQPRNLRKSNIVPHGCSRQLLTYLRRLPCWLFLQRKHCNGLRSWTVLLGCHRCLHCHPRRCQERQEVCPPHLQCWIVFHLSL